MTNYEPSALSKESCARLRGLIARFDVNQAELAVLCDVSQSQFSKIIRGVRPMTVDQLAALCEALDVDLVEFITDVHNHVRARDLLASPVRLVEDSDRLDRPTQLRPALYDPWASAAAARLAHDNVTHADFGRNVPADLDDLDAVARATAHDLRHTAASLAVAAGANPLALQKMLGHESAAMTLDVYSELFDDDLNAVAERLQDAARAQSVGKPWADAVA